jgi:hypothetical protein
MRWGCLMHHRTLGGPPTRTMCDGEFGLPITMWRRHLFNKCTMGNFTSASHVCVGPLQKSCDGEVGGRTVVWAPLTNMCDGMCGELWMLWFAVRNVVWGAVFACHVEGRSPTPSLYVLDSHGARITRWQGNLAQGMGARRQRPRAIQRLARQSGARRQL